ncbi:hypothetical protein PS6_009978 [Mucor atramentarius]
MQEAKELASESTYEYSAHPLEVGCLRGPKDTDFEEGRYHGRIILPSEYPFKPPELIFLTPNGRFELNTKICLSITGFHPEFWQPAWGIRTVLLAVIGFFPTEARGAIGGLDYSKEERRRLAKKSIGWVCRVCEVNTKDALSDTPPDVPCQKEELPDFMITYKPEHGDGQKEQEDSIQIAESSQSSSSDNAQQPAAVKDHQEAKNNEKSSMNDPASSASTVQDVPPRTIQPQVMSANDMSTNTNNTNAITPQQSVASPLWLDALIAGLVSFIAVLVCRRYVF